MRLRSLLFVPGDRPERMEKALGLGADALILDLEDAVAAASRPRARAMVAEFLAGAPRRIRLFVRVNPLDSEANLLDLDALVPVSPDGIVFPKAAGAASIDALVKRMAERGLVVPILPIATETPAAIFQLGSYSSVRHRLCGLTWGAEDLSAAVGAVAAREEDGGYTAPYEMARALTLFGAHAADITAIETVYLEFNNIDGLSHYTARAVRDGFSGMMAIHPAQIDTINAAFTPSAEALGWARAVVDLFDANPGAGALRLDGKMIDAPHRKLATRLLKAGEMN